jgi:preprotein translocase subunit SecY
MDTIQQVQSHLLAHQYEGLLEKSQLRGKGKGKGPRKKRSPVRR